MSSGLKGFKFDRENGSPISSPSRSLDRAMLDDIEDVLLRADLGTKYQCGCRGRW